MLLKNKLIIGILCLALSVFLSACNRSTASEATAPMLSSPLVRVSADGVDAAEPTMGVAPDGSFYLAWVNHEPNNRADVMIGRYEPGKHRRRPCALIRKQALQRPGEGTSRVSQLEEWLRLCRMDHARGSERQERDGRLSVRFV